MSTLQLVTLALVQGLTEFLPISSSAHLILVPHVAGWPDQGLAFDVAAHLGSLLAVCAYFRHDLARLGVDWTRSLAARRRVGESALAWAVLLGTLPVALAGLLWHDVIAVELRAPLLIAATTIGFGVVLWGADVLGRRARGLDALSARDVAVIGLAQALALIPGTSRSGITMTAALALGLTRDAAARFSFLLSVPVIVLAGAVEIGELVRAGTTPAWGELGLVVLLSASSAFACIHLFLAFIGRLGMWPFAVYRLALGVVLVWLFA